MWLSFVHEIMPNAESNHFIGGICIEHIFSREIHHTDFGEIRQKYAHTFPLFRRKVFFLEFLFTYEVTVKADTGAQGSAFFESLGSTMVAVSP